MNLTVRTVGASQPVGPGEHRTTKGNMQIEIEELKRLIGGTTPATTASEPEYLGQNIAVLDRGFVYVGNVTRDGDFVLIENARNIRVWGTTNGLGELRNGPLSGTKMDVCGTVKVPFHALQHLIACNGF